MPLLHIGIQLGLGQNSIKIVGCLISFIELEKFKETITKHAVPFLSSNSAPNLCATGIEPDHHNGMRLAMQHLYDLGHRNIAYVGGGTETEAGIERHAAFKKLAKDLHLSIPDYHIQLSDWDLEKAEQCAEDMLRGKNPPTAIIGANDQIAVVIIRRARKLGIHVPRDLSVVGFSNEFVSELSDPPLTVVDMHHDRIGHAALQSLLDHAEGPNRKQALPDKIAKVPASLIVRQSTAKPKS